MVAQAASRAESNANTLRRFGVVWVRNLLANLDLVVNAPGATTLPGRFAGLPALVLAAGPSLALVLPQLRRLRRGMLVVAVDRTSYRELARYRLSETATWAHPALVGSRLLVKDREHLLVFDLSE